MNDHYLNRLNMGRKVLACLNQADHLPLWQNQAPVKFTTKAAEATALLVGLEALGSQQSLPTTGNAADKRREEQELEDSAHALGRAVVVCCRDAGDEAGAAPFDLTISGWRKMRDETLRGRARELETKATALAATPDAADYGITPAAVAALKQEADDYAALIAAPDVAISERKTLTGSVRPAYAAFEAKLQEMDDLVLAFRSTAAGAHFVAAYFAARSINDRGVGPGTPAPAPTPPAP